MMMSDNWATFRQAVEEHLRALSPARRKTIAAPLVALIALISRGIEDDTHVEER
jgi:hypothetical protein